MWPAGIVAAVMAVTAPSAAPDTLDSLLAARKASGDSAVLSDWGHAPFTLALWFRTDRDGALAAHAPAGRPWERGAKALFIRGGRLCFDVGWVDCLTGRTLVNDGAWHHVVLTGPAPQRIYLDGRLEVQGALRMPPDPAGSSLLLGFASTTFPDEPRWQGALDEVVLYGRTLDADGAAALYEGRVPAGAQPVAQWPMEGATADDVALPVVWNGTPTFTAGHDGRAWMGDGKSWLRVGGPSGPIDWDGLRAAFAGDPRAIEELNWLMEDRLWPPESLCESWEQRVARYRNVLAARGAAPQTSTDAAHDADAVRTLHRRYVEHRRTEGDRLRQRVAGEAGVRRIIFVKRLTYSANHYYTEFINSRWAPGGGLFVLDLETGAVREVAPELRTGVTGRFDLSFDGTRVVFAWKKEPQAGYRIYEAAVDGSMVRPLTFPEPNEADLVQAYRVNAQYHHGTDDMDPCYLPDGGIAFISTRCRYGILCDGPDDFTTTVLYRMDADGGNLRPLSNSSVSEAAPAVLPDGRILYTRWEYVDKGAVSVKCLWAMRPDGTASVEIYGNNLDLPPTLIYGRPLPGSPHRYLVLGTPHYPQNGLGTVIELDVSRDIRTRAPMTYWTPAVDIRAEGGFAFADGRGGWRQDREGRGPLFKDPCPLAEDLALVAHKPASAGPWYAPAGYGLYALDAHGALSQLYRDPDYSCWHPLPLRSRERPPVLNSVAVSELAERNEAVCLVTDVHRGLEGVAPGTIRHLRILEQVPRPWEARRRWDGDGYDQQHVCISKDTHLGLKVQHGIVPVEADGSAHFLVPSGRNIFFQALDEHFLAVQTERTFVNYQPGEVRGCTGCHERSGEASVQPSGMPLALGRPPSRPGPQPGETVGARTLHYPRDVQPVLDRHCVRCHQGARAPAGLVLTGDPTALFSVSYEALVPERRKGRSDRGLLGPVIGENHPKTGNVHYLPARSLGSHASVLAAMFHPAAIALADPRQEARARTLAGQHKGVVLDEAERIRLTNWIDTNAQYYGSYWGRRNLRYAAHPHFRPEVAFEQAAGRVCPWPDDER